MPVFRVEKNKDYTVMANYHLRDKSLSLKAKGLLSQMLSLPEDWDYTLSGLCCINRESKDAIRSAVNELERAGYIERRQTTDEGGKFSSNEYIIHEHPVSLLDVTGPVFSAACPGPGPDRRRSSFRAHLRYIRGFFCPAASHSSSTVFSASARAWLSKSTS